MQQMPDWKMPADDGTQVSAAGLRGKPYILYFYPKDLTPGCTTEACDFRDRQTGLAAAGVPVFGVSPDPLARHQKFRDKHSLNFRLLADAEHVLAEKLGVWGRKKFMGRAFDGIIRTTFLVDGEGGIVQRWDQVRVKGHAAEVVRAAQQLAAGG